MSRGWGVRSSPADLLGLAPVSWGALLALQRRARRSAADNHSDTSGGCKSVPRPQLFFRSVHLGRIPILLFGGKKAIISPKSVEMQTCKALCSMKKTQAGMPVKLLELQVCSKWYCLYKAPLPPPTSLERTNIDLLLQSFAALGGLLDPAHILHVPCKF